MAQQDRYFSRVYHKVVDEFNGIWRDDTALATWLRLLILADKAWPSAAPLPRSVRPTALKKLTDAGLVELVGGDLYRIRGMDKERQKRRDQAAAAAAARWD